MLRRYTDEHPDVVNTRRLIAQLERGEAAGARGSEEGAGRGEGAVQGPPMSAAANPVFQQLKVALAEAEANVASLRARVGEFDGRYRQLQTAARMLPEIEAQFAQLNRDYEVQKRNYESLVARRESAALTTELDATGVADFRIIDPPTVSQTPVAPNRMFLLADGAAGRRSARAYSSASASSQVFPTFHDARMLRELTQRPVLGTVELQSKSGDHRAPSALPVSLRRAASPVWSC